MNDEPQSSGHPDGATEAIGFRVRGRVQGVCFRWFGRDAAEALGLHGWIRNRADGAVEGEAFGPAADLATFLDRLRLGPDAAQVDDLESWPVTARPSPGFEIRR